MKVRYAVIAVGAGPDGCAICTFLARGGHHVLVPDKVRSAGKQLSADAITHVHWTCGV